MIQMLYRVVVWIRYYQLLPDTIGYFLYIFDIYELQKCMEIMAHSVAVQKCRYSSHKALP